MVALPHRVAAADSRWVSYLQTINLHAPRWDSGRTAAERVGA